MKYCVSGRHQYPTLKKADEVKVRYEDRDRIIDFVEKIPDKSIILMMPKFERDYDTWHMYDEKFEGGFYLGLFELPYAKELNEEGIKWYWPFPITSFYELKEIMACGPSQILLGPPLTFQLPLIRKIAKDIKIRMTCNCARPGYLVGRDGADGLYGSWVRPEDAEAYGAYVDVFEFENVLDDLKKESTLLHIYKDNKEWPGNLNLLLDNFNINVDNRAIPESLGEARIECGQRCLSQGMCHFCDTAIKFAENIRQEHFDRKQQAAIDNN